MSLDDEQLADAQRRLGRNARFFIIDSERSRPDQVVFLSSRGMPFVASSKRGFQVFWDTRFFQYAGHLFRAMANPSGQFELPTSGSTHALHLESVIWCALAERTLNRDSFDVELATGILMQGSVFMHHSLRVLGPFDADVRGEKTVSGIAAFEQFVAEHEHAHFAIKAGRRPSDEMISYVAAATKMIEQRLQALRSGGTVSPKIIEQIRFAADARDVKWLMEEVWADAVAFENVMTGMADASAQLKVKLSRSLLLWILAVGALYGIAALRLLGMVDALLSPSSEKFDEVWERQRRQFSAREVYARIILLAFISEAEEDSDEEKDAQVARLDRLSYELFDLVDRVEVEWRERRSDGRLDELRGEGRETIAELQLDADRAINLCGDRLGWFRGQSPARKTARLITVSDDEASSISRQEHLVHMVAGKSEGRAAFYFVLVQPEDEPRFLEAVVGGEGEAELSRFGQVIAANFGNHPSLEVLAFLGERFGFKVPKEVACPPRTPIASTSSLAILNQCIDRSLRAVAAFAVATTSSRGRTPGTHRFIVAFDPRFEGVRMPAWLPEVGAEEMSILLEDEIEQLSADDVAFDVTLDYGERSAEIHVPFLALRRFSDPSVSVYLEFPSVDQSSIAGERSFLALARMCVGDEGAEDRIDYPLVFQRAQQATLIWLMSAFSQGLAVPKGDCFQIELDPLAMTRGLPGTWRLPNEAWGLAMVGMVTSIREEVHPAGWWIESNGASAFVPTRAVRRLVAISGVDEFELSFDWRGVDWV